MESQIRPAARIVYDGSCLHGATESCATAMTSFCPMSGSGEMESQIRPAARIVYDGSCLHGATESCATAMTSPSPMGPYMTRLRTSSAKTAPTPLMPRGESQKEGGRYWIARHSGGTHWNDEGFFRIRRGRNMLRIEEFFFWGSILCHSSHRRVSVLTESSNACVHCLMLQRLHPRLTNLMTCDCDAVNCCRMFGDTVVCLTRICRAA
jgi:hypothetical protein